MMNMRRASLLAVAVCLTAATVLMGQEGAGTQPMAKPLNQFTIGDLFPKLDLGLDQTASTWKTATGEYQTKAAAREKAVMDGIATVKQKSEQLKAEAKTAQKNKDFTAAGTAEGKLKTEETVQKVLSRLQGLATQQKETAEAWNRLANAMSAFVQADKDFDVYRSKGIAKPESAAGGSAGSADTRMDAAGVAAFQKHTATLDALGKGFADLGAEIQTLSSGRQKFLSELEKGGHIQPPVK